MTTGPTNPSTGRPSGPPPVPLCQQSTPQVVTVVVNVEIDALLGRTIPKDRVLQALEARREIAERMVGHRWLAMETARAAGASWAEIDTALGLRSGLAQSEYESALARQKQYRLVAEERHDPGPHPVPEM